MSTYSIKVNCSCGKILKVPEKYAGKRVKCPCERKISIPSISEIKQKIGDEKEELRNCPTCGAFLNKDDVICVACRMNLQTGEWDNSNPTTYTKPKSNKLEYFITAAVVLVVVTAGIWVISTKTKTTEPSTSENITMSVGNDEEDLIAVWSSLGNMPEDSAEAIDKKTQAFAKKIFKDDIVKAMSDLENKKYEFMAKETHVALEKQKDINNPILNWYMLEQLANKFEGTNYIKKVVRPEQEKEIDNVTKALEMQKQEIQQNIAKSDYQMAINVSFSAATNIPFALKGNPKIQPTLMEITKLYQHSISKLHSSDHGVTPHEEHITEADDNMQDVELKINSMRGKIDALMDRWEYSKAFELASQLAVEAEKFRDRDSSDISYILDTHGKLIHLAKLWDAVEQGIEASMGKNLQIFLNRTTKATINGKIIKYQKNKLTVEDRRTKKREDIEIIEVRPRDIVKKFALSSDYPKDYVRTLAAYFYKENDKIFATRNVVEKLDKPTEEHNEMLAWANKQISQKKEESEALEQRKEELDEERVLLQKESALERDKQRAWEYSRKAVSAYNDGNFKNVLNHLQTIKNTLPKSEVSKMSQRVGSEYGQSLKTIADKCINMCSICEDGMIGCRNCVGDGKIKKVRTINDEKIETFSFCKVCIGSGKVKCFQCARRRFSKPYQLLVSWYQSLH